MKIPQDFSGPFLPAVKVFILLGRELFKLDTH
jgi:hypothetical protein